MTFPLQVLQLITTILQFVCSNISDFAHTGYLVEVAYCLFYQGLQLDNQESFMQDRGAGMD